MDIVLERILSLIPKKEDGKFVHGAKKAFSDKLNLPHNLVIEWEKGRNKSYHNYLYEIAAKYDVSVEWLKGETDIKKSPAKAEDKRTELIASLDDMSREELIALVNKIMDVLKEK